MIIGGGPAGLSAAIELGKLGVNALLVDDKHRVGGKLVLADPPLLWFSRCSLRRHPRNRYCHHPRKRIENNILQLRSGCKVPVWLFSAIKKLAFLKMVMSMCWLLRKRVLVASGAREKFLAFKGNTLPGVYGAGAFQTLVNRDLVKPAEKLFIVGGGNVGLDRWLSRSAGRHRCGRPG